ncbi:hypothetical protein [Streptomyces sp. CC219B]|nr:hypothetical protein [Streptomyces sp. CC219B]
MTHIAVHGSTHTDLAASAGKAAQRAGAPDSLPYRSGTVARYAS